MFCPSWSEDSLTVVLEQDGVLAVSARARAAGVREGMRRGGALLMAPDAQLRERAPPLEAEALHAVAMALLRYTPLVAQAEEDTLLIDVGASLRLFGGARALCRLARASMRALGFTAVLGCAPTARGAWLLARGGGGRSLTIDGMTRRLRRLPAGLLPPARPFLGWLDGIGCFTLAELRRLPRPGLQRRCGRALLDMLDAAHGEAPEMFDWITAPPGFKAKLELFDRVEHADALLFGAQRLLQQMTGWLCARQFAVERVSLLLEHERGRVARAPTQIEIVLAEATWRDEHLLRLLKERLGKIELAAPVIGLSLEALRVRPMTPPSDSLFPEPGGSKEDRERLFELLVARLGADNVLQAAPQADYRPDLANAWVPVHEKVRPAEQRARMPPRSLPRPVWLLPKPVALLMRDHRPFYTSPLRMVSNAERIEAGWWSEAQTRDYFIAEGADHAHYWVFRERLGAEDAPRWYLHGLFG
ncbi:protein ImuB [Pseudoduganella namucuonensis]|uniref:Protein ImuB n=1 Tax=Pseudoduganella namucuonensis TaxID=1035707 RepID=A0A1I7M349_9BURK|nr:protein ImuB [Pseudoduganella namucuonensis]